MCLSSVICAAPSFTSNFVGSRIGLTYKTYDLPNAWHQSRVNGKCLLPSCTDLRGAGWFREVLLFARQTKSPKPPQDTPLRTSLPTPFCLLSGLRSQNYSDRMESSDDWHANVHNNCPTLLQFLFITYSFQYQ